MASQRILEGLKVLDFTQNLPGPYATFLLEGWGANVIKVEPPKGDPARHMEPFFSMVNRGKRSIVLDLRDPASRPSLEALVRWADVLVEGFRPTVMARLGCDYDTARVLNPSIVYCSISAFGQQGPLRDHPGHDLNLQAIAGVCHVERDAEGMPRGTMLPIADLSTSLVAVSSITAALVARERTGEGAYLDVAMGDAVLSWANVWGLGIDMSGNAKKQLAGGGPLVEMLTRPLVAHLSRLKLYAMSHYGVYRCKGDTHLSVGIVDEKHFWESFCRVVGMEAFASLPMPARTAASPVLRPLIARRLRTRTADDWNSRFMEAGVPTWPVRSPAEARDEPQVRARGAVDSEGWMRAPLPGAAHPTSRAPTPGEHTDAILVELGIVARDDPEPS